MVNYMIYLLYSRTSGLELTKIKDEHNRGNLVLRGNSEISNGIRSMLNFLNMLHIICVACDSMIVPRRGSIFRFTYDADFHKVYQIKCKILFLR